MLRPQEPILETQGGQFFLNTNCTVILLSQENNKWRNYNQDLKGLRKFSDAGS